MLLLKAIVIGSGIGGLATAVRLAAKGVKVDVFESNPYPGGKLNEFILSGFRFDAGPSLFTMPQKVDELFICCGKNPRDYFNYTKSDVACVYHWDDNTVITAYADKERYANEVAEKLEISPEVIKSALKHSSDLYQLSGELFIENSLHRVKTYLSQNVLRSLASIRKLDIFSSMNQSNAKRLKKDKLVQIFNRYATYNGSNPYKAPAVLNLIPHLEHNIGTFFPVGGMQSITQSIYQLCLELGVTFHFNSPVQKILTYKNSAIGVEVNSTEHKSDTVISNMDVYYTYKKLLPDISMPKNIRVQERSSSALIFYWGVKKSFPKLHLHNIFFSNKYKEEFESIFEIKNRAFEDPTVYVHISSKFSSKDSPEGMENWFVMINTPSDVGQDWDRYITDARGYILKKLKSILKEDVGSLIVAETTLSPPEIQSKTSSYQGSLYGTSSNSPMAAFLRHANFSNKIKNLYFVGGSVHPGGGIPLCLSSAKIVSEMIQE